MKILICSRLFYPDNLIGAVRPTNFASNLFELGNDITVLTGAVGESKKSTYHIHTVNEFRFFQRVIQSKKHSGKTNVKQESTSVLVIHYLRFRRELFAMVRDLCWYISASVYLKRNFKKKEFDVVLSSYGPLSSYMLGYKAKMKGYAKYWVCDLRDLLTSVSASDWANIYQSCIEKRTLFKSDLVLVVSKGQKEILTEKYKKNLDICRRIEIVYNGFSEQDGSIKKDLGQFNRGKLSITYTGALYSGLRDLRMLFEAIDQLNSMQLVDLDNIVFHYAGDAYDQLTRQFPNDSLLKVVRNEGFLSRKESVRLQEQSDLLVVLSWNTHKEKGILTGKFLEYLCARKNIIGLISGDLPNAELSELIHELCIGESFEYAQYDKDLKRLKTYILLCYTEKMEKGVLSFSANVDSIHKFNYIHITQNLNSLLKKYCK